MNAPGHRFGCKSVAVLSIPIVLYFGIALIDTYQETVPWLHPALPVVIVVVGLIVATFIDKQVRFRKSGYKPSRPGFSGEIELLSEKIDQRIEEAEQARRFGRALPPLSREFVQYARQIIQTAMVIDKKEILAQMKSLEERDGKICLRLQIAYGDLEMGGIRPQLDEESFDPEFRSYINAMTLASDELKSYAADIKMRGGLYKISRKETAISSALAFCFAAGGIFLLWRFWQARGWMFWMGAGALVVAAVIVALLIDVLKDQEAPSNR